MKIALTGSSGGIGRAIITEAKKQGHELVCIDRVAAPETEETKDLHFIQAEMDDFDALVSAFAGCDALIHMAAIPSPGRHPDHVVHNNNVVGSYNALQAAVDNGIRRICQASSVNAIGHSYSRDPHYDYLPIDEEHPNYSEEPYSLSKWICEAQADAFARRWDDISIASMRFHWVVPDRSLPASRFTPESENHKKHLFAYTRFDAAARACLLAVEGRFKGHEAFYIVAPDTTIDIPSREAAERYFPGIPIKGELSGRQAFFNSSKAERMLGWKHDL